MLSDLATVRFVWFEFKPTTKMSVATSVSRQPRELASSRATQPLKATDHAKPVAGLQRLIRIEGQHAG